VTAMAIRRRPAMPPEGSPAGARALARVVRRAAAIPLPPALRTLQRTSTTFRS